MQFFLLLDLGNVLLFIIIVYHPQQKQLQITYVYFFKYCHNYSRFVLSFFRILLSQCFPPGTHMILLRGFIQRHIQGKMFGCFSCELDFCLQHMVGGSVTHRKALRMEAAADRTAGSPLFSSLLSFPQCDRCRDTQTQAQCQPDRHSGLQHVEIKKPTIYNVK